ncbi:hypothetical protein E4T38_06239 [Aureobasidium subglaciale]|nr:hypothetical protein E4T38_06239 [Aureobasidium subglaciale]KAI5219739.1 hypothetical protein E4T40_06303 [Aureobasidium subglaciale]KAI5223424.1 hypothetical protein E4T41_06143 [Aureobasidium subglaciale]KAI5260407.1 hypothetical protein E4T46_05994 [Aureobasidium subglaciale]
MAITYRPIETHLPVSPNAIPFSIDAFRDQHRDYYFSIMDFDTTAIPKVRQDVVASAHAFAEDSHWGSVQLRENNRSFVRFGNCSHFWDYKQMHCPCCAARTLHHVPGVSEASKGSNSTHKDGADYTESVEEEQSWATITTNAIVASAAASSEALQGSSSEPIADPSGESNAPKTKIHRSTIYCCFGKPGVARVVHCCCGNPDTHDRPKLCTQPCIPQAWPITAAVIFGGPAPSRPMCGCSNWGTRHVCRRFWGAQHVEILEDEVPSDDSVNITAEQHCGAYVERKAWWRLLKWLCCC